MKNNRKKQTSSYLLIFLGIVAALLILIILYLTFFKRDSQRSINLAKNGSATAQTEDFTDGDHWCQIGIQGGRTILLG